MKTLTETPLTVPSTTEPIAMGPGHDVNAGGDNAHDESTPSHRSVDIILLDAEFEPQPIPALDKLAHWGEVALDGLSHSFALRIVSKLQIKELNATYAQKNNATNVLSFPSQDALLDFPESVRGEITREFNSLGDIAICAEVVADEASEQGKALEAHWAHMIIHGVLHLRGFDHANDAQAQEMEANEVRLLDALGFADPYADAISARIT